MKNRFLLVCAIFAAVTAPIIPRCVGAQPVVGVSDAAGLQNALNAVSDGGVIELAGGTYAAPGGAFTIYSTAETKSFTVRAAQGATVVLTGNGIHDILRFGNTPQSNPRPVTFQGLVFSSGVSTTDFIGGAATLTNANAVFIGCTFNNNSASPSISGGGSLWIQSGSAAFQQCNFIDNSSTNYGAAFSALDSKIFLRGCTFRNNRTNVPGHSATSLGGAINNSDSSIQIDGCIFDGNQAGYVGGAIFAGGKWDTNGARLLVSNSLFVGNVAAPYPGQQVASPPLAGAVHVEDNVTAAFTNCRFVLNSAQQGGAISSYRSVTTFNGCVFDGNSVTGSAGGAGSGGSIFAISADTPDASTANGTINRRSIILKIQDTLFRGAGGGKIDALHGGAIFVSGDTHAAYGTDGIQQNGSEDSNRATVELTRVAFTGLNTNGTAGAMTCGFVNLKMDTSIVDHCSSANDSGGVRLGDNGVAQITNSTISYCHTGALGGGLAIFSGTLNMSNTAIFGNSLSGGGGSGLLTSPIGNRQDGIPPRQVDGLIQQCTFSENTGGAMVYDGDGSSAPFNLVQYGSNTFFSSTGTIAYHDDVIGNLTVPRLNAAVIPRSVGPATAKTTVPNIALGAAPERGAMLLIPRSVQQVGAPGETTPIRSQLIYTSSARGVIVDGSSQPGSGVIATVDDRAHTLRVGSTSVSTTPTAMVPLNISTRLAVGTGDNALIGGFIIVGNSPKRVLVRAMGPSLAVTGTVSDTTLQVFSGPKLMAQNDDWGTTQTGGLITAAQEVEVMSTGIPPSSLLESAIMVTLDPGSYTAVVHGANGTTGNALVEVYDLDTTQTSTLANISTRGLVQIGDNVMIGGFIVRGGAGATKIVVRGLGPSLPVSRPLVDPTLDLVNAQGTIIDSNDDWATGHASELKAAGLAPTKAAESAIYRTDLARGAYTAVLRGKNGSAGVGLVEVYVFQ
ncbi:MAG: hypothetical protein ACJ8IQ_08215 [Chthoniobacterales bacterium]